MLLQVFRRQSGLPDDPGQHRGSDFLAVVKRVKTTSDRSGRDSVRCDPDSRLMRQPIRSSAASTRHALAAGQRLIPPLGLSVPASRVWVSEPVTNCDRFGTGPRWSRWR